MLYTEEKLDRSTGELITVSRGEWITVTELGALYGVSRIKVREVLREMDFLFVPGGQAHQRHRLRPWVVQAGFGKFIPVKKGGPRFPFDVVSPAGQAWIEARWDEAVSAIDADANKPGIAEARQALIAFQAREGRTPLSVQGQVLWLCDHHPSLSHAEAASIIGVSQQLVSRHASVQRQQRQALRFHLTAPLEVIVKEQLREEQFDVVKPPAEQGELPKPTTSAETSPDHRVAA